MDAQLNQTPDPSQSPQVQGPSPDDLFKQKYKTPRDLLLDPNFHAIHNPEVKRELFGEVYPEFNNYDKKSQDDALGKGLTDWQKYYSGLDAAAKPKPAEPGFTEKVVSALAGGLPAPPGPVPFPAKNTAGIPGAFPPEAAAPLPATQPATAPEAAPAPLPATAAEVSGPTGVLTGPTLPLPPGAGSRATGIAAPIPVPGATGARAAGAAAPTPAQTQRPTPLPQTPIEGITAQIQNKRQEIEDSLAKGKANIDALKAQVVTPPPADAPFQEREDYQHKLGVLSDMIDAFNNDSEQKQNAFNTYLVDAQKQLKTAPAKYADPEKISADTIRAVYDFFAPGLLDKMSSFYELHPAVQPLAQGLAQGTTLSFIEREKGMPPPTGAYAKSMEWIGEQVGSLPYYYEGGRLIGLAAGLLPKLPIVGDYLGTLLKLPEAMGVRTAAAKTAEEAAEIASKMAAAGKTIEAPAALADALRIAGENPNLTRFLTVPAIKGAQVGTALAAVGAMHAIANGENPYMAALQGYELALAGEMIAGSPPMRALVDKMKLSINDPSVRAMFSKIGISRSAFQDYVDQGAAALKEQPEFKKLYEDGEAEYAQQFKAKTAAGTLHEMPEKDDFLLRYVTQNAPAGTSPSQFIANFARDKVASEHPEYEVLRTFLNNYLTQGRATALGEAVAGATSYGLAAAGIQIAHTPGDILAQLKAGGRAGLSTFLAVGAFHLPSVIAALQAHAGRDLDPTEAATEYDNMTAAERKLLVGQIAQPDIDKAVENINREAGQTPPSSEPNPIPPGIGATAPVPVPVEPTSPPAEAPTSVQPVSGIPTEPISLATPGPGPASTTPGAPSIALPAPPPAKAPFMVTTEQRTQMTGLGYGNQLIDRLTPDQVQRVLAENVPKRNIYTSDEIGTEVETDQGPGKIKKIYGEGKKQRLTIEFPDGSSIGRWANNVMTPLPPAPRPGPIPGVAGGGTVDKTPPPGGSSQPPVQAEERVRGSVPADLNEDGIHETEENAQGMAKKPLSPGVKIEGIYTSDWSRARQTADIYSQQLGVPILGQTQALQAWHLGPFEGQKTADVIDDIHSYVKNPDVTIEGRGPLSTEDGESFNDFKNRGLPFFQQILQQATANPNGAYILVTHYRYIKLIQAFIAAGANGQTLDVDPDEVQRRDGDPGAVYHIARTPDGLNMRRIDPKNDEPIQSGVYLVRHGTTDFNQGVSMAPPPSPPGAEEQPTYPESLETVGTQVQALGYGGRKVVYVPQETLQSWVTTMDPDQLTAKLNEIANPQAYGIVGLPGKGLYIYRSDMITGDDIQAAVDEGREHELMGIVEPKSENTTIGVRAEVWDDPNQQWIEAATAVVSPENLAEQVRNLREQFLGAGYTGTSLRIRTGPAAEIAAGTIEKRGGPALPTPPQPTPENPPPNIWQMTRQEYLDSGLPIPAPPFQAVVADFSDKWNQLAQPELAQIPAFAGEQEIVPRLNHLLNDLMTYPDLRAKGAATPEYLANVTKAVTDALDEWQNAIPLDAAPAGLENTISDLKDLAQSLASEFGRMQDEGDLWTDPHKDAVEKALRAEQQVPDKVIADYPDLAGLVNAPPEKAPTPEGDLRPVGPLAPSAPIYPSTHVPYAAHLELGRLGYTSPETFMMTPAEAQTRVKSQIAKDGSEPIVGTRYTVHENQDGLFEIYTPRGLRERGSLSYNSPQDAKLAADISTAKFYNLIGKPEPAEERPITPPVETIAPPGELTQPPEVPKREGEDLIAPPTEGLTQPGIGEPAIGPTETPAITEPTPKASPADLIKATLKGENPGAEANAKALFKKGRPPGSIALTQNDWAKANDAAQTEDNVEPRAAMDLRKTKEGAYFAVPVMSKRASLIFGKKMYEGKPIDEVALRELLQNAIDAVRGIKDPTGAKIDVNIDSWNRQIIVTDTGVGMSTKTLGSAFVDPFSSLKVDENGDIIQNASGGFGVAKVAIYGAADNMKVDTTHYSRGHWTRSTLEGRGDDWASEKGFPINVETDTGSRQRGTRTELTLKDRVRSYDLQKWAQGFLSAMRVPYDITIKVDGKKVEPEPIPWEKLDSLDLPSSAIDVYLDKSPEISSSRILATVMVEGMPMFNQEFYVGESLSLPPGIALDIHPKADPAHETIPYPLTLERNSLTRTAETAVDDWIRDKLVSAASDREIERNRNIVYNGTPIAGTKDLFVIDSNKSPIKPELVNAIANDPYVSKVMNGMANAFRQAMTVISEDHPDLANYVKHGRFMGIGLGGAYNGVTIQGDLKAGFQHDRNMPYVMLINPFRIYEGHVEAIEGTKGTDEAIQQFAIDLFATMMEHEPLHTKFWNHDEKYAGALTHIDTPRLQGLEQRFGESVYYLLAEDGYAGWQHIKDLARPIIATWSREDLLSKISSLHGAGIEPGSDQIDAAVSRERGAEPGEAIPREIGDKTEGPPAPAALGLGAPRSISELPSDYLDALLVVGSAAFRDTRDFDTWCAKVIQETEPWVQPFLNQVYGLIEEVAYANGLAEPPAPEKPPELTAPPEKLKPPKKPERDMMGKYQDLIDRVKAILANGESFNNPKLQALANDVFGGERGEGAYTLRDMYDAFEAGVSAYIEESKIVDFKDPTATMGRLAALQSRLVMQADRTMEQIELQQFSTPPMQAFLTVAALGNPSGVLKSLEPSAGTGMIATMLRAANSQVRANEIDPRRAAILKLRGFLTTTVDGLHLTTSGNDLSGYVPDAISMNPPFSAGPGATKDMMVGGRHVMNALQKLAPGGRLVAIVGDSMGHGKVQKYQKWWGAVEKQYNVIADVGLAGKFYSKMGTTYPERLIVIDKTGPTTAKGKMITGEELSPADALGKLASILGDDIYGRTTRPDKQAGQAPVTPTEGPAVGPRAPTAGAGVGEPGGAGGILRPPPEGGPERGELGPVPPAGVSGPGPSLPGPPEPGRKGEIGTTRKPGPSKVLGGRPSPADNVLPKPLDSGQISLTDEERRDLGAEESAAYTEWTPRKAIYQGIAKLAGEKGGLVVGATPHPADLIESATLASVEPPDIKKPLNLPDEVIYDPQIGKGRMSDAQLEAATYMVQSVEQALPDGRNMGAWCGDGTGVGKGREIAGVIYHYLRANGNKKAVWISANQSLLEDAKRDIGAVGVPLPTLHQNDPKYDEGAKITEKEGVLFTQYSTAAWDWNGSRLRFAQLNDWLGKDFDGVIALDECHNLKNAIGTSQGGASEKAEGSQRGEMGLMLSQMYPHAKFLYVSATGATLPHNMAYMDRLGLWGPGAPFADFMSFHNAMLAGGLGSMEMLARDLKAVGSLVARQLSYKGVEYGFVDHKLNDYQVEQYNKSAELWSDLIKKMEEAEHNANQSRASGRYSQFYSTQQRFFLQLMTTYQMQSVLADMDQSLAQGMAPIINILSTNETLMVKSVAKLEAEGRNLEDLDLGPRQMLKSYIEKYFPLEEMEDLPDPNNPGRTTKEIMTGSDGRPVINQENLRLQEKLLNKLEYLNLPDNPIDMVAEHLGGWGRIAEVSGREQRMENGKMVRIKSPGRQKGEGKNNSELRRFQMGKADVLLITGAGNAGISAQAEVGLPTQNKRRVMYCAQPSWSADQQMQFFGRAHRSNQVSAPIIKLVRTNVRGQERLFNAISRRLAGLGASTQGNREALGGNLFGIEDLTDGYGKAALMGLASDLDHGSWGTDDMSGHEILDRMGWLTPHGNLKPNVDTYPEKFLNRVLVLPVNIQNAVFENFYDRYRQNVTQAKELGTFDTGVQKIRGTDIEIGGREVLHTDPRSKAKTELLSMEGSFHNPRMAFSEVNNKAIDFKGFYSNLRSKRIYAAMLKIDPQTGGRTYDLIGPHATKQSIAVNELENNFVREDVKAGDPAFAKRMAQLSEPTKEDLARREEVNQQAQMEAEESPPLDALPQPPMYGTERAQFLWDKEYGSLPDTVRKPLYMLTGAIFPIYDRIVGDNGLHHLKVVRAKLKDGSGAIGLQVQANEVANLRSRMGLGNALAKESGQSIYHMVRDGATLEFDNGWRIYMSAPVHGERRMEINTQRAYKESIGTQMKSYGAVVEVIIGGDSRRPRIFIPLDDNAGPKVLDKILGRNKIARVISTGEAPPAGLPPSPGMPGSARSMGLRGLPDGERTMDMGKAEPPRSIEEAVSAADFWIKKAQDAVADIRGGHGNEIDQRDLHQAPVIAQHLLNWIENQDSDQWDSERDHVSQVINEARQSAVREELYNPDVARNEADHYGPHIDRMAKDLKGLMPSPALPPLEPEPGELQLSDVPGLPAPPTSLSAPAMVLPPPAPSTTFSPTPPPFSKQEMVRRNDILTQVAKALNVPIRYARFRRHALGIFKVGPNVIRTKLAQDVNVAAHEIGHAVNKILWGTLLDKDLNWSALIPFSGELNPIATKPAKGQPGLPEGFAEFVRYWITDPAKAKQFAPHFFDFFNTLLDGHPDLKDSLTTAQTDYGRWLAMPSCAKVLSMIQEEPPSYETNWWLKFYTNIFDQLAPLEEAVKQITAGAGLSKPAPDDDPYILGRLLAGWAGKVDHFLRYGTFDPNTLDIIGPALEPILEPMRNRLDDLRITGISLRALEKLGIQGKEVGISAAEAQDSLRQQGFDPSQLKTLRIPASSGFPAMTIMDPNSLVALTPEAEITKQTLQQLYKFQDDLFQYFRKSGMISPELYAFSKLLNQFYIPFHRLYEAGAGEPSSQTRVKAAAGRNVGNLWQPVKKFTGSWRPIEDPLSSIVKNAYTLINIAERNRVGQALGNMAAMPNAGKWIEGPLPTDMHPTTFAIDRIKQVLSAAGIDVTSPNINWDQMATVFVPGAVPKAKENTITVHYNGKPRLFQLQPDLYRAVMALDRAAINPIIKMLSLPATMLRLGATGLNPEFAGKMASRRSLGAFMQTNTGFIPPYHTAIGVFHALGHTDFYQEWLRSGGPHAALATIDQGYMKRYLKELLQNPLKTWVSHPLQLLKMVAEVADEGTRIGIYYAGRKHGLSIRAAGFESRFGGIDFHRMGAWTQAVNMLIPFFNDRLQGADTFFRMHRHFPFQTLIKASALTAVSLLVAYLNRNNQRYKEMPWFVRDTFWLFPTDVVPGLRDVTPFIPVPKSPWWAMAYCNPVERIAEWIHDRDSSAFDGMLQDYYQNGTPGLLPEALKVPLELIYNKNMYTGRPIESQWQEKNLPPEYRSEWYTGKFAKEMALAFAHVGIHVSPEKIEFAIFGSTGGAGRAATKLILDPAAGLIGPPEVGATPAPKLIDLPLIRALAVRYPSEGLRSITAFEDLWNGLEERSRSYQASLKEPGKYPISPLTSKERTALASCQSMATLIAAYNGQLRRVTDDTKMSGDDKRTMIDSLYLQILMAAKRGLAGAKGVPLSDDEQKKLERDLRWPPEAGLPAPPR